MDIYRPKGVSYESYKAYIDPYSAYGQTTKPAMEKASVPEGKQNPEMKKAHKKKPAAKPKKEQKHEKSSKHQSEDSSYYTSMFQSQRQEPKQDDIQSDAIGDGHEQRYYQEAHTGHPVTTSHPYDQYDKYYYDMFHKGHSSIEGDIVGVYAHE